MHRMTTRTCLPTLVVAMLLGSGGRALAEPSTPEADVAIAASTFWDSAPRRGLLTWRLPSPEAAQLLAARDFVDLERLAGRLRDGKVRDEDGMWMLRRFYEGVSKPKRASEQTWKLLLARLEEWLRAQPASITARVALAEGWCNYGWFARGEGLANKVSDEAWGLLHERCGKASEILSEAKTLSARCPETYAALHAVAMGLGWSRETYDAMFDEAVAFEPTYYDYYLSKAYRLLPRWGGKPGEWAEFASRIAERTRATEGSTVYARVATHVASFEGVTGMSEQLDWPKARQGFRELLDRQPESRWFLNYFALFAWTAGDAATARPLAGRIGDSRLDAIWGSTGKFDQFQAWARK